MAGKAGRSGRKKGALSWYQNPVARCGHRLNVLIEMHLALAPERGFTVPPKTKRALAERAMRDVRQMHPKVGAVDVDAVLAWSRRQAPKGPSLRRKVRPDPDDQYAQYLARISSAWRSPQPDPNPGPGDDSAVSLIISLDSADPSVCWTETDETIIASAVTTFSYVAV
jgi:hypothetical protein